MWRGGDGHLWEPDGQEAPILPRRPLIAPVQKRLEAGQRPNRGNGRSAPSITGSPARFGVIKGHGSA
jgi:hypothetical protein